MMNSVDLRERIAIGAPLTPDQRDYLLSILSPPRQIAAGDIFQIDSHFDPDKLGGVLLVASGAGGSGSIEGYLPDWGMQRNGLVVVRMPLTRVKHTGGSVPWPIETFVKM